MRFGALTAHIIRAGFKERDIYPLNPALIADKLQAKCNVEQGPGLQIFEGEPEQVILNSPIMASISPPTTAFKLPKCINKIKKQLPKLADELPGIQKNVRQNFQGQSYTSSDYRAAAGTD